MKMAVYKWTRAKLLSKTDHWSLLLRSFDDFSCTAGREDGSTGARKHGSTEARQNGRTGGREDGRTGGQLLRRAHLFSWWFSGWPFSVWLLTSDFHLAPALLGSAAGTPGRRSIFGCMHVLNWFP